MADNPAKRVALFRKMMGLAQREMAEALGVSTGLVGNVESGVNRPSRKFLERLSDTYQLNADWVLHGRGDMRYEAEPGFQPANARTGRIAPVDAGKPMAGDFVSGDEGFTFIHRAELSASAGPGIIAIEEGNVERIAFQNHWLRQRGILPDFAGLLNAEGDSMEPDIPDGALMLVGFDISYPVPEGFYVYRYKHELFVKKIKVIEADGIDRPLQILALSSNPKHDALVVEPREGEDFKIIARVVSVIADL